MQYLRFPKANNAVKPSSSIYEVIQSEDPDVKRIRTLNAKLDHFKKKTKTAKSFSKANLSFAGQKQPGRLNQATGVSQDIIDQIKSQNIWIPTESLKSLPIITSLTPTPRTPASRLDSKKVKKQTKKTSLIRSISDDSHLTNYGRARERHLENSRQFYSSLVSQFDSAVMELEHNFRIIGKEMVDPCPELTELCFIFLDDMIERCSKDDSFGKRLCSLLKQCVYCAETKGNGSDTNSVPFYEINKILKGDFAICLEQVQTLKEKLNTAKNTLHRFEVNQENVHLKIIKDSIEDEMSDIHKYQKKIDEMVTEKEEIQRQNEELTRDLDVSSVQVKQSELLVKKLVVNEQKLKVATENRDRVVSENRRISTENSILKDQLDELQKKEDEFRKIDHHLSRKTLKKLTAQEENLAFPIKTPPNTPPPPETQFLSDSYISPLLTPQRSPPQSSQKKRMGKRINLIRRRAFFDSPINFQEDMYI